MVLSIEPPATERPPSEIHTMTPTPSSDCLMDQIDEQQSQLLWMLDELNERVERTLREQLTRRAGEETKAA
jgi:hypothetical protein